MDIKKIIAKLTLGESIVVEPEEGPKSEIKDPDFAKKL